jgi:uncharacterized membrane protein YgcG
MLDKSCPHRRLLWAGSLILVLAFTSRVAAVAPEIKDGGKFFSAEAIQKAAKQIRDIAHDYDRDLLIETFATIPGEQAERVKALSPEERAKFFHNWATDRAEAAVVHGVYILVCKEPRFLEIVFTSRGRAAFDRPAFEKLRAMLVKAFREQHYDEGLLSAVQFVRERFAAASKERAKKPDSH